MRDGSAEATEASSSGRAPEAKQHYEQFLALYPSTPMDERTPSIKMPSRHFGRHAPSYHERLMVAEPHLGQRRVNGIRGLQHRRSFICGLEIGQQHVQHRNGGCHGHVYRMHRRRVVPARAHAAVGSRARPEFALR